MTQCEYPYIIIQMQCDREEVAMATQAERSTRRGRWFGMELLVPALVVVGWFLLMRFVLPKLGVPT